MNVPFHFCLPQSFRPAEFLPPKLMLYADDARYLVSLILTKIARQLDDDGEVRLMAKYLSAVMQKHKQAAIIQALLEAGAIMRSRYVVGRRAFGYSLADRFRHDKHVRIPATCPRLIGRLEACRERAMAESRARMLPVHLALERQQWRLRIDGGLAREIVAGLPAESNPFDAQGILIADIEDRDFRLNVGEYGRVTNNITSMKREVRAALRFRGERLFHADIACCQPALIAKTATAAGGTTEGRRRQGQGEGQPASIYDSRGFPPDGGGLDRFCELVQCGCLYERMLDWLRAGPCPGMTREQVKRRFLADVIAKRKANRRGAEYPSDVEDCFRSMFPEVYQYIRNVNRDGWEHENLIRLLQREESKLVIETVCADLVTRHPRLFLLTLHDAIYTTERGIPLVEAAFKRAFKATGFAMTLKIE